MTTSTAPTTRKTGKMVCGLPMMSPVPQLEVVAGFKGVMATYRSVLEQPEVAKAPRP